jgi:acyl carrier protein
MSEELVYSRLRSFISGRVSHELADHDSLIESGAFDSIGILELVAFIEKEFGLRLEHEDVSPENFASIQSVAGFVLDKVRA